MKANFAEKKNCNFCFLEHAVVPNVGFLNTFEIIKGVLKHFSKFFTYGLQQPIRVEVRPSLYIKKCSFKNKTKLTLCKLSLKKEQNNVSAHQRFNVKNIPEVTQLSGLLISVQTT